MGISAVLKEIDDTTKLNGDVDLVLCLDNIKRIVDSDPDQYRKLMIAMKDSIREDVDNRRYKIKLGKVIMTKGNLLTLLILFRLFNIDKSLDLSEKIIQGLDVKEPSTYSNYYNNLKDYLLDETSYNNNDVSQYISLIIDQLTIFSLKNVLLQKGSTISVKDVIDMYKRYPKLKKLMEYSGETENLTVSERNRIMKENKEQAIDIIRNDKEINPYREYIDSKAGINLNQFNEVFLTIMYKPDTFGNVIPIPIYTSFAKGLNSVRQYYIDCIGARTALITSKIQVRKSGKRYTNAVLCAA